MFFSVEDDGQLSNFRLKFNIYLFFKIFRYFKSSKLKMCRIKNYQGHKSEELKRKTLRALRMNSFKIQPSEFSSSKDVRLNASGTGAVAAASRAP